MSATIEQVLSPTGTGEEHGLETLQRLFAAAQPGAVFGDPITSGNYTVITAREIVLGGGFGFGKGLGAPKPETNGEKAPMTIVGGGSGVGGGGGSNGRPVAVVVIGPEGVRVEPIVDVSKVVLAGISAWSAALALFVKMRRARKA